MGLKHIYSVLFLGLLFIRGAAQDVVYNDAANSSYSKARELAFAGKHGASKEALITILSKNPKNNKARALLASTYSWSGDYEKARGLLNTITATERNNRQAWISSVKNELYAKNNATALGLANKALSYLKTDTELERLREMALGNIKTQSYPKLNWFEVATTLKTSKGGEAESKKKSEPKKKGIPQEALQTVAEESKKAIATETDEKKPDEKKEMKNRIGFRNAFTIFDQRYDPNIFSSISLRHKTMAGSIIPRINYSNRRGLHGVQYDLDFYPKFSKRFYAYMNYGYSNAQTYPKHKLGGDLYVNLPWAFEFSAGGRFISFATRDVSVITNSLGHYRGNYYFSLRSYITPQPGNLTRVSGNLLVRKYLRDAENFMGLNVGMGYSPELRQIIAGDELLAETLLYIESQRLSFEYQFTPKQGPNIYRANVGITRQELAFDVGNFFLAFSAGLTYQVKF